MTAEHHQPTVPAPAPARGGFARFVDVVQFLALVAGCVTVVLLFAVGAEGGATGEGGGDAAGAAIYAERCASCHGEDRGGVTGPSLVGVGERLSPSELVAVVEGGRNGMPAFGGSLATGDLLVVAGYVASAG
ncbi:MAG: cytochrome c [Actinomycetota bacterium]|nr:cytochrome c [Actinomycetota bacterium]